ncbi:MAG: hypothetical protein LBU51_06625 [Bacteroidales bacterium]|nr:hypothetical protein [Bacteroidales bacterium]
MRSIIIILLHTLLGYTIIDCFFANSLPDYNTTTGLWMAALLFFAIYLFIDLSARLFLYIFNYFQYYKIYNSLLLILLHLNCFVILPGIIIYFYTPFKAIIWIMLTINVFLFVIFFIRVLVLNTMCKINQFSFVVCFITYIVLPLVAIEKMLLSV